MKMTEKKQIEELAKALRETKENAQEVCHIQPYCRDLCKYSNVEYCLDTIQAELLYKQGYRNVAKEIEFKQRVDCGDSAIVED